MANLLKNLDQQVNLIVMDIMAVQEQLTTARFTMRALGFLKRFMSSTLGVINTMISDRVRRYAKPFWIKLVRTKEEKNTSKTTKHFVQVYNKYSWKPYVFTISMILTEKPTALLNEELLSSWRNLSGKVLFFMPKEITEHSFEEPDVEFVGETIKPVY